MATKDNKIADVCFIVEGSYPYVKGGVASWVHQILNNYQELNFEMVVLLASDKQKYELKYDLPKNLIKIHPIYITKTIEKPTFLPTKMNGIEKFDAFFKEYFSFKEFENLVQFLHKLNQNKKERLLHEALYSEEIFDYINELYSKSEFQNSAYLDFFWSIRSIYLSFLNVLTSNIPKAKVYHTVSTGYAGLYSSMCKIVYPKSRVMLTEHGIYTRERKMDITIADWVDRDYEAYNPKKSISLYKNIWAQAFEQVSLVTYYYSDEIISLNQKNNEIQIAEGAKKDRVYYVRNGVNLDRFSFRHREFINKDAPIIGFLGRVVKVKDVKTFIKAAKYVVEKYPKSKFIVAGPTDEDEEYFRACENLVKVLNLDEVVIFQGLVQATDFLQEIDLMVLTSLSEGQPLVIAEANACGVPCVATDVGGCKEMIEGSQEDQEGFSGLITNSVNPEQTAKAIIRFIEDDNFYKECSFNGRQRALKFYDEKSFLDSYKDIYMKNLALSEGV